MNNTINKILIAFVCVMVVGVSANIFIQNKLLAVTKDNSLVLTNFIEKTEQKVGLSAPSATTGNIFSAMSTSSALTITTSSTFIIASSSTRQYCAFVNDGDYPVYFAFNDVPATVNSRFRLNPAGGNYEINLDNLYKGAIRGVASGGNSIITVSCKE